MSDDVLKIKDLYVTYTTDEATVHAVNGLSLNIRKGKRSALSEKLAAGKTTTALSILKMLPDRIGKIERGQIYIEEYNVTSATEQDMRLLRGNTVSMIFQDPMTSLNPILTVGYQIKEVFKLHNTMNSDELEDKVCEILRTVGIPPERRNDYPHQFSGGMKQRIVIAIALACKPILLLADEPTTALDVTIQAQVLALMTELKENSDMSMLLITHDLGVVAEICDDVAIMYAGEIIENGTVEDVFEGKHHHPYTDGLFGSIPDLIKSSKRLHPIEGLMPDLSDLPKGCAFYDRCPHCSNLCREDKPSAISLNKTHSISCHLFHSLYEKEC